MDEACTKMVAQTADKLFQGPCWGGSSEHAIADVPWSLKDVLTEHYAHNYQLSIHILINKFNIFYLYLFLSALVYTQYNPVVCTFSVTENVYQAFRKTNLVIRRYSLITAVRLHGD